MTDCRSKLALIGLQARRRTHFNSAAIASLQLLSQSIRDTTPIAAAISIHHDPAIIMTYGHRSKEDRCIWSD